MKRLSDAQMAALRSSRDHNTPTWHIRGKSQWAAWGATRMSLMRAGLLTESGYLTELGREVLVVQEATGAA